MKHEEILNASYEAILKTFPNVFELKKGQPEAYNLDQLNICTLKYLAEESTHLMFSMTFSFREEHGIIEDRRIVIILAKNSRNAVPKAIWFNGGNSSRWDSRSQDGILRVHYRMLIRWLDQVNESSQLSLKANHN